MAVSCFAESLFLMEEYEDALSFFQDVLPMLEEQFGDLHELTLKSVQTMALCFVHLEDPESASFLMEERYQRVASLFGNTSIRTIESLEEWAEVLILSEWHEKAAEHLERALLLRQQLPEYIAAKEKEDAEPTELSSKIYLLPSLLLKGRMLLEEGDFEEVAELLREVVLLEDSFSAPDLPATDAELARNSYADALASAGQYQEALKSYQHALPILKETLESSIKASSTLRAHSMYPTSAPNLTLIENDENDENLSNNRSK